jgi:hypothetical protein
MKPHAPVPVLVLCVLFWPATTAAEEPPQRLEAAAVARKIDRLLEDHWTAAELLPASTADDLTLFRRVTLDLAGRVPTAKEVRAFAADRSPDRHARTVRQLLDGPEFAGYFATVLDEVIQGRLAGNEGFINYLRRALREGKGWDVIFREVMLGPWDTDSEKPATLFLDRRGKDLDVLTVDVGRAFFGVDISCARCHDHPLVRDWKQDHYYGLAAFLNRTESNKGKITEKADGEVKFTPRRGQQKTAPMMFLTGRTVEEPKKEAKPTKYSRREQLVKVALEERGFLSRALVNRVWAHFLGSGLVEPVDQMHSGNPASVGPLLDWLAADFAESGYDVKRLVAAVALSRAYRLDSRWTREAPVPPPGDFAVARLRPLSPRQMAVSLVLALGEEADDRSEERVAALEKSAAELMAALDPRTADFQSSTRESLFVSNSEAVRKLVTAGGTNLTARLSALREPRQLLDTAFHTILSRPPQDAEVTKLTKWLDAQGADRRAACASLVWALAASAEFRFNH